MLIPVNNYTGEQNCALCDGQWWAYIFRTGGWGGGGEGELLTCPYPLKV